MPAANAEQKVLRRSIIVTVLVGATGVLFGALSGSLSIIFDGVFSAVDASMTAPSLMMTRLIARDTGERFQLGFWHIEPMVLEGVASVVTQTTRGTNEAGTRVRRPSCRGPG